MNIKLCNIKEEASKKIAAFIAKNLTSPLLITFSGEIGAGKTTIIREILRSLSVTSRIKSPTFSLVESYTLNNFTIHHFDLYRINDVNELEYIGFRDYFKDTNIIFIEWPQRAPEIIKEVDVAINLTILETDARDIEFRGLTSKGLCLVEKIESTFAK